jgi:hypothetical protein
MGANRGAIFAVMVQISISGWCDHGTILMAERICHGLHKLVRSRLAQRSRYKNVSKSEFVMVEQV